MDPSPSPSPSPATPPPALSLPPSPAPPPSLVSTVLFCGALALTALLGILGNLYALWRLRGAGARGAHSLRPHIASLALADLLYLGTAPFIVYDSLAPDWAFGELGCRLLPGLDLLTMLASAFTLSAMSLARYRAVARPLAASAAPPGALRPALAWALALALSLPMMLALRLQEGAARRLCAPAWDERSSRAYLSLLFCSGMLAPGLAVGGLHAGLARLYRAALRRAPSAHPPRAPQPRLLLLVLAIVLAFWLCFLPFWLWQLLPLYRPDALRALPVHAQVSVNRALTWLTYANSCLNPFFYTLLTGPRGRHRARPPAPGAQCPALCPVSSPAASTRHPVSSRVTSPASSTQCPVSIPVSSA
ncbi:urotensin-2 receptor [Lepisosteus oculatus]|uniref:urotensin-2 receptor n=1 Tax=Lepisosteus oculatus TaxID=7918 RepID=UPI0037168B8D